MNRSLTFVLVISAVLGAACSPQHAQSKIQRQPLEKPPAYEYKTPPSYAPRVRSYNPKTGEPITYDHKPRVEVADAKTGKYAFKWIGFDGRERTATFYRIDAVDVLVSASVVKLSPQMYQYTYEAANLPSSGTYLKSFMLQTFSKDVKPAYGGKFLNFAMSRNLKGFEQGTWIDFADVSDEVRIDPGQSVTIEFSSPDPPGLVECRAGAETIVNGSDEDVPEALYSLLRGYDEYLHGWTIGPVDNLKNLSPDDKAKYLLDKLPQFRKLGWITDAAVSRYQEALKRGDLNGVLNWLDQDLKAQQIAPEIAALIQGMK
jgi:hypothetical protein